jgi:hypothetical protein
VKSGYKLISPRRKAKRILPPPSSFTGASSDASHEAGTAASQPVWKINTHEGVNDTLYVPGGREDTNREVLVLVKEGRVEEGTVRKLERRLGIGVSSSASSDQGTEGAVKGMESRSYDGGELEDVKG